MELVQLFKRIGRLMRKFNIYNITQKRNENGVCASSPQELIGLYEMSDEKIRILAEVPNTGDVETIPIVEKNDDGSLTIIDVVPVAAPNGPVPEQQPAPLFLDSTTLPVSHFSSGPTPPPVVIQNTAPKFFTDNGTEYKTVEGHLYKKTWVNVNMDYYRIVNDKTNKIVNLVGKTVQTLDWVEIKGG